MGGFRSFADYAHQWLGSADSGRSARRKAATRFDPLRTFGIAYAGGDGSMLRAG
jgi:hypothetical protein